MRKCISSQYIYIMNCSFYHSMSLWRVFQSYAFLFFSSSEKLSLWTCTLSRQNRPIIVYRLSVYADWTSFRRLFGKGGEGVICISLYTVRGQLLINRALITDVPYFSSGPKHYPSENIKVKMPWKVYNNILVGIL